MKPIYEIFGRHRYNKSELMTLQSLINKMSGKSVSRIIRDICHEQIGVGCSRHVYSVKGNDKYVIKIEYDPSAASFCNVTEWRNYIDNKDYKPLSVWMAPCHAINQTGQVMIQSRVYFKPKALYPKKIPSVFTDTKTTNYGWLRNGGKFVCCDYPMLINTPFKLKNVRWRAI